MSRRQHFQTSPRKLSYRETYVRYLSLSPAFNTSNTDLQSGSLLAQLGKLDEGTEEDFVAAKAAKKASTTRTIKCLVPVPKLGPLTLTLTLCRF